VERRKKWLPHVQPQPHSDGSSSSSSSTAVSVDVERSCLALQWCVSTGNTVHVVSVRVCVRVCVLYVRVLVCGGMNIAGPAKFVVY
jgi:hypothetical protein